MVFTLIDEVGLGYSLDHEPPDALGPHGPLHYPVCAARAADGTTVIVDELGIEKSLPLRAWYRTLRIDSRGGLVADSRLWKFDDAYGFLAGDSLAILRISQWSLLVLSTAGTPVVSLDLSSVSKQMPIVASSTERNTFLVAFADNVLDADLAELDYSGRLLWYLPRVKQIGFPTSIQQLQNGNVLVGDEFCHVVREFSRDGSIVWQLGSWRDPGSRGNRLSSPRAACETPDGTRVIADTRNHRILTVARSGEIDVLQPPDGGLTLPTFADKLANGNLLVCDAGNRRVVECTTSGQVVTQYGGPAACRRWFSFPRSTQPLADGGLLIADTANDRIVRANNGVCDAWPLVGTSLFWPRCARLQPCGSVLVADGRNGRILEIAPTGAVIRQLDGLRLDSFIRLGDPHDVRMLPSGNLLITDASLGMVVEADWSGCVLWMIGGPDDTVVKLKDPHSAQQLENTIVLISDSGNDRLLWVDPRTGTFTELGDIRAGSSRLRLKGPRHAEVSEQGVLVVADTGNNRVLAATPSGELVWEFASVPGTQVAVLNQPRWAILNGTDELIVSDHYHHRILRLRFEPGGP